MRIHQPFAAALFSLALVVSSGCSSGGEAGAPAAGQAAPAPEKQPAPGGEPRPLWVQGRTIFVETGVTKPDRDPTWYAPMVARPHAPTFEILATRGTRGRYYPYTYAVTLKDIVKMHGHDCEGLTHAACCCKVALEVLFPEGIVDRSLLRGISGNSPCWSDVTAFLTGGRVQYGTLGFFKDKRYGHAILLYREDTRVAVLATWKKGINTIPGEPVMLPAAISWKPRVPTAKVMELKKDVKRRGKPTPHQVDLLRYYQYVHVNDILSRPLKESYQAKQIENFKWEDWIDPAKCVARTHERGDIKLRTYPNRRSPTSEPE